MWVATGFTSPYGMVKDPSPSCSRPAVERTRHRGLRCRNWSRHALVLELLPTDRAGLGKSDRGLLELTPVDEIHHLHAALRHLGVSGPTLVVGHSYGGVLGLLHALLYPDDVVGLVLVDPMNPGFV